MSDPLEQAAKLGDEASERLVEDNTTGEGAQDHLAATVAAINQLGRAEKQAAVASIVAAVKPTDGMRPVQKHPAVAEYRQRHGLPAK